MNDIDYNAVIEIINNFLNNEKVEIYGISYGEERQVRIAIENLLKERQADKDRIKEKIEWLREISDNGANAVRFAATHDDEIERTQKQKDISTMIGILQELLRESD